MRESITKKKAKRKGPLQNPAGGRRSKRRKSEVSASSPSDSHSDSEEESGEEDYSYHYDGDTCEAYDCTRPVSDKVSWVSKIYFKWRLFFKKWDYLESSKKRMLNFQVVHISIAYYFPLDLSFYPLVPNRREVGS